MNSDLTRANPLNPMSRFTSAPGALRLLSLSIIAQLPLAAFSIALLVHTQHLTGSFADAGIVTGVYAAALGAGGPLLGQLVDRHGQTVVLIASAGSAAALLVMLAMLPVGAPLALIAVLAIGGGLVTPPIGPCVRALFGTVLPDREAVQAAYTADATAAELTWVCGPPLALGAGALWSTGAALAAGGIVLVMATAAIAVQPASRRWRPAAVSRPRGGSLATPAIRTLVIVFIAVGVLFGAAEVAVTAAAETFGNRSFAAPLLALWGAGSLGGGLLMTRFAGGSRDGRDLPWILAALAVGHLALAAAAGNGYVLGAGLFFAGAAIAPAYASLYAIVDRVAPEATLTEAFTWMDTAVAIGSAIGAAIGGTLINVSGPIGAFALAGAAGAAATIIAVARRRILAPPRSPADLRRPIRARCPEIQDKFAPEPSSADTSAIRVRGGEGQSLAFGTWTRPLPPSYASTDSSLRGTGPKWSRSGTDQGAHNDHDRAADSAGNLRIAGQPDLPGACAN